MSDKGAPKQCSRAAILASPSISGVGACATGVLSVLGLVRPSIREPLVDACLDHEAGTLCILDAQRRTGVPAKGELIHVALQMGFANRVERWPAAWRHCIRSSINAERARRGWREFAQSRHSICPGANATCDAVGHQPRDQAQMRTPWVENAPAEVSGT